MKNANTTSNFPTYMQEKQQTVLNKKTHYVRVLNIINKTKNLTRLKNLKCIVYSTQPSLIVAQN